ncbi:inositol monophosphatase family protein [Actinomyces urinae]|uniref:inositol monophosphatase family protein n=1 Tax=Actinomyces urinae TaxID=1689268 RepID=UPI00092FEADD|nr:inositol monophosphatase [Actinomyces urinae]
MSTEQYRLDNPPRVVGLDPETTRSLQRADLTHELALMCRAAATAVGPYLLASRVKLDAATTETKANFHDPVTPYDKAAETAISALLGSFIPGSLKLGEEHGEEILPGGAPTDFPDEIPIAEPDFHVDARSLASRVKWIVDPIDGTANFAAGFPYFGTSVAASLDGEIVAGAITVPYNNEVFWADETEGWIERGDDFYALKSGNIQGSKTITAESEALLLTYFPTVSEVKQFPDLAAKGLTDLLSTFRAMRRPGACALDLAQVAAGRAGAVFATRIKPWDIAAGVHLVRVSGGHVDQRDLGNEGTGTQPAIAATSAGLKSEMLASLLDQVQSQY